MSYMDVETGSMIAFSMRREHQRIWRPPPKRTPLSAPLEDLLTRLPSVPSCLALAVWAAQVPAAWASDSHSCCPFL
jgi:hypothetical protein